MTQVFIRSRAIAGLNAALKRDKEKIKAALKALESGSFPPQTKKLGGVPSGYRTRIGRWRILFVLRDGEIDVADIFLKKGRSDYRRWK